MLSDRIFSDTPTRFFAILSGRYRRHYVEVLDAVESVQRGREDAGVTRAEMLDIITRILEEVEVDSAQDEGDEVKLTPPEMLRSLISVGWLEEPRRNDYQRVYYLDSRAEMLLESLRRMAYPERVSFTDKLHMACTRLIDPAAFVDHPLADLEGCIENLRYGLQEIRLLQQGLARLTQRQLGADTLKQNLSVLYDDFAENIGQRCYKQLVAMKLPLRLPAVREAIAAMEESAPVIARMEAELLARRADLDAGAAAQSVRASLVELSELVESIEPQAEAVDRRAADFARRSFARFRYLQEVSGGRRNEVREVFELINEQCRDRKMADLPAELELFDLNLPSISLIAGRESLYLPRESREKTQQTPLEDYLVEMDGDFAVDEMSDTINSALTVIRANRYYASLPVSDDGLTSADLPTDDEEWLLDVAGLLLHTDVSDRDFHIHSPREKNEEPAAHELADYLVDDFAITPRD